MSCYNSEWGIIQFSKTQFPKFRRKVIEHFNKRQDQLFELATEIHGRLQPQFKGKRLSLEDKIDAARDEIRKMKSSHGFSTGLYAPRREINPEKNIDTEEMEQILDSIFPTENYVRTGKMVKPKKKDFPKEKLSAKRFTLPCADGDATLDQDSLTLHWRVEENNRAVEDAHSCYNGRFLFEALREERWPRKSGGEFYYTDEYGRDAAMDAGCSAERTSLQVGPLGLGDNYKHPSRHNNRSRGMSY